MAENEDLEGRALRISVTGYLVLGILAVVFAMLSRSEAIMLDGFFNFVSFVMSLITLKVSRLLSIPYDKRFQYGFMPFEPFVNVIKGLIILVVCGFALVSSIDAVIGGGRELSAGTAVVYSLVATGGCIAVFMVQRRIAKKLISPLLELDLATWKISGFISSAVAVGFGGAYLLSRTEFSYIVPYVDPLMVVILVLVMIRLPLSALKEGIADLLLGAPGGEIQRSIREGIAGALSDYPEYRHYVRMIKVGRHVIVTLDIVLPVGGQVSIREMDGLREKITDAVTGLHPAVEVDTLFTANDRWAAAGSDLEVPG